MTVQDVALVSYLLPSGRELEQGKHGGSLHIMYMQTLNLELGVFGGLVTPVCSYILSEGYLCHSTEYWGLTLPCVVLYWRLRALAAELPW